MQAGLFLNLICTPLYKCSIDTIGNNNIKTDYSTQYILLFVWLMTYFSYKGGVILV